MGANNCGNDSTIFEGEETQTFSEEYCKGHWLPAVVFNFVFLANTCVYTKDGSERHIEFLWGEIILVL